MRGDLKALLGDMNVIERWLTDEYADALGAAEEAHKGIPGAQWDDYTEHGEGILYPENAVPELDSALHHLREAIIDLRIWLSED